MRTTAGRIRVFWHRSALLSLAVLGFVVLSLVGMGVSVAYADRVSAVPTVTFTGTGLTHDCGSHPDVGSIGVHEIARVNLLNRTGVTASVNVDGVPSDVTVANGRSASVRLRPGQQVLRLIPNCVESLADAVPVTVYLLDDSESDNGTGAEPSRSGRAKRPKPPAGVPTPIRGPLDPSGPLSAGRGDPPPTPPRAAGAPLSSAGADHGGVLAGSGDQREVLDVVTFADDEEGEPARHLLAIVATICVSGVTVGIFRAILSQHTNRALPQ